MSVFDERTDYKNSPYYEEQNFGDFTPFYVAIAICTVIGISLFVLNIVLGCCSRYSGYWNERHSGNRWIVTFWTSTPHNSPPVDLRELEDIYIPEAHKTHPPYPESEAEAQVVYEPQQKHAPQLQYVELKKRESDI